MIPNGGYFKDGKYIHSFYAEIAKVIEQFFEDIGVTHARGTGREPQSSRTVDVDREDQRVQDLSEMRRPFGQDRERLHVVRE